MEDKVQSPLERTISRRDVLRLGAVGVGGLMLAACGGDDGGDTSTAAAPASSAAPSSSAAAPASSAAAPATTAAAPATSAPAASSVASSSVNGSVSIWYDTGAAWSDLIAEWEAGFGAMYPDVKLEWVAQDAAQIQTKLLTGFSTDNGPDVAFAHVSNLVTSEFEGQSWADLTSIIAGDEELSASFEAIPPGIRDSFVLDGKTWGSPSNAALVAMYIRQSWLEQVGGAPPTTWDELVQLALKFKEADPAGGGKTVPYGPFGAPSYDGTLGQWQYFGLHDGWETPVITPDGAPSFATSDGERVAQFYYDIVHTHKITSPDVANWTFKEFYQATEAGVVGIGRLGSWNIPAWKDKPIGDDFIAVEFPASSADRQGFQYQSSNGVAISEKAQSKDAAVAWLKYFLSKDAQTAMFKNIGAGARFDLDWAELLGGDPRLEFFFTQEHRWLGSLDVVPTFLPVGNELGNELNKMVSDSGYMPADMLASAQEKALKAAEDAA